MLQNGWILFSGGELESLDHILVAMNVKLNRRLALLVTSQVNSQRWSYLEVSMPLSATSHGRSASKTATRGVVDVSSGEPMPFVEVNPFVITSSAQQNSPLDMFYLLIRYVLIHI